MPLAIKMQEEYGDDVQFLFIESQGASAKDMEKFVLQKKWFSDAAIWTCEPPFETGAGGIPHCVVLSNDGEVLINDNPLSAHTAIEEALKEQLKLAKKGPSDLGPLCRAAWVDFEKGNFAAAIKSLEAVPDGVEKDAADKLSGKLAVRAKAKLARLDWLIESAEFEQADKLAATLAKGLAGHELATKLTELSSKLTAKEMAPEREAAKQLEKLEKRIAKDGLDAAVVKALNAFGEKFGETRAGKRAKHMAELVGS